MNPPGTSASEPGKAARPRTGTRRPRTAVRPTTSGHQARPDTAVSGITEPELPDKTFWKEDDEFDEDEEYAEESDEEEDPFAFVRPQTGAPPRHAPGTADTGMTGMTAGTTAYSTAAPTVDDRTLGSEFTSPVTDATGALEAGRVPELAYSHKHGVPFAGKDNLNNSSFAFSMSSRRATTADSYATSEGSFAEEPRRQRSKAPLIPSTAGTGWTGTDVTGSTGMTGHSRRSIGMTEMTGDMTVPEGKITYGDGQGGVLKDVSEQGEDVLPADYVLEEEDSPYPEVRASVSNIDDYDMPSLTFRAWLLGLLFAMLGAAINTFFAFRTPSPYLSPLIVQVLVYPVGKFFARIMTIRTFQNPRWLGGHQWSFNPGPFNIKEHAIIAIMSNVSIQPSSTLHGIVVSEYFYKRSFGFGFNLLFMFSSQITGFALAGIAQRFVVQPASMIWPSVLMVTTNLNTLHAEDDAVQGGMTRFRFMMYAGAAAFAYYFLPGFLFTALSYFSWVCWIAPNSRVVNELFGVSTGLGLGILTLDWSQIAWFVNPLIVPWWAIVNVGAAFILLYWVVVPALYYSNTWYTGYIPINVQQAADRFGQQFNVINILNEDRTLNVTAYHEYSPVYLSATYNVTYMAAYALTTAILVHTILFHGPKIYRTMINIKTEADDVHAKLMKKYPGVPAWWYFAILFIFGGMCAIVAIEVFQTGLPVWSYFIAIAIPAIYILPAALIFAMTSQTVSINLIGQVIPGLLFAGKPIATLFSKMYSIQALLCALLFVQDLKLSHYMKVPPRNTFIAQLSAMLVAATAQLGVKTLLFATVPDMCAPQQENFLTCGTTRVYFTANIIWGLVGPRRLYGSGSLYNGQTFAALAGALLPIPIWLIVRKRPQSWLRNVNLPVALNGVLYIPPATGVNYASWLVVGGIFQFYLRRMRFAWWSKYNYVLAAALDIGTGLSAILIFLVLILPRAEVNWWGNNVYTETMDWQGTAVSLVAPEEGFGPAEWR